MYHIPPVAEGGAYDAPCVSADSVVECRATLGDALLKVNPSARLSQRLNRTVSIAELIPGVLAATLAEAVIASHRRNHE